MSSATPPTMGSEFRKYKQRLHDQQETLGSDAIEHYKAGWERALEVCSSVPIQSTDDLIPRWEYYWYDFPADIEEKELNEYGSEGWELCAVTRIDNTLMVRGFFKRLKP